MCTFIQLNTPEGKDGADPTSSDIQTQELVSERRHSQSSWKAGQARSSSQSSRRQPPRERECSGREGTGNTSFKLRADKSPNLRTSTLPLGSFLHPPLSSSKEKCKGSSYSPSRIIYQQGTAHSPQDSKMVNAQSKQGVQALRLRAEPDLTQAAPGWTGALTHTPDVCILVFHTLLNKMPSSLTLILELFPMDQI